jgi:uncharacterized Ntn-hydrolase superfamily protein
MASPSTFSIVAYDPDFEAWGVAVASKFPAVGAVVPWVRAGAGAVATQSYANTSFGPRGLELMASGMSSQETLDRLLDEDEGRAQRQVGMVDAFGRPATFTGESCHTWAGGRTGKNYAVQGNILVGEHVLSAMADAFKQTEGNLPQRLIASLLAGDNAGGDRRGRQSAAIYVARDAGGYGGMNELYFGEGAPEERLEIVGEVHDNLCAILIAQEYLTQSEASDDQAFDDALERFIGNENFEERADISAGWIDEPVYAHLLKKFEG